MQPLLDLMRSHHWQLRPEEEVLGKMREVRSETGFTPRPKIGYKDMPSIPEEEFLSVQGPDTPSEIGHWDIFQSPQPPNMLFAVDLT